MLTPLYTLRCLDDTERTVSLVQLRELLPSLSNSYVPHRVDWFMSTLQSVGFVTDDLTGISAVWSHDALLDNPDENQLIK